MEKDQIKSAGGMEKSPLLSKDEQAGIPPHNSTIHPDKLEQSRFTERISLEEGSSPVRIIIYVIIVIAVGVGAALLVRNLITKNQESETEEQGQQVVQIEETFSTAYSVNKTTKQDSLAPELAVESDYIDSTLVSIGDNDESGVVDINKVIYDRYQTFARVTIDLTGVAIPKSEVKYDSVKNMLTVSLNNIGNYDPELLKDAAISDIVKEIRYNANNVEFIIFVNDSFRYRVVDLHGDLVIDIKPLVNFTNQPETTTEDEPEPVEKPEQEEAKTESDDTVTDSAKPAAPHYSNEFSQNTQYVSSNVSGNTIGMNEFYYEDTPSFFELSWGARNQVGDNFVPNAKAYYKNESGTDYLYVEIENQSQDAFQVRGLTETDLSNSGINLAGANFVSIRLMSFENGKSTYRIQVKNKANFKLLTQKTISGETQVLSIQIAD